jgi:hypothetical protein
MSNPKLFDGVERTELERIRHIERWMEQVHRELHGDAPMPPLVLDPEFEKVAGRVTRRLQRPAPTKPASVTTLKPKG